MTPALLVNAAWPRSAGPHGVEAAQWAVSAGADGLVLPESPRLFADPLVLTERVLAATDVPLAGPCVLGLGLRHPAPVAAALRTLAEGRAGRLFAALARGESSVRNEGLAPPRLDDYFHALDAVVQALGTESQDMTVLGAASGPRTIAGTAERLGGVLIDVGAEAQVVAEAVAVARQAHPDARCWVFLRAIATTSEPDARHVTSSLLGSAAARLVAAPDWYRVPRHLAAGLQRVAAAHDYRRHGTTEAGLGADDGDGPAASFVRHAFFVTGNCGAIADRLRPLARLGLDGIVLAGGIADLPARLAPTVAAIRAGFAKETKR